MATDSLPVLGGRTPQNVDMSTPPIDTEVLFARCMGNASFALSLLGALETSGRQQVDAIVMHAVGDEPQSAADAAHSLKGAAAIIGADLLRTMAEDVETAGHAGDMPRLLALAQELRDELNRCLAYIPTVRDSAVGRPSSAE